MCTLRSSYRLPLPTWRQLQRLQPADHVYAWHSSSVPRTHEGFRHLAIYSAEHCLLEHPFLNESEATGGRRS